VTQVDPYTFDLHNPYAWAADSTGHTWTAYNSTGNYFVNPPSGPLAPPETDAAGVVGGAGSG